MPQVRRAPTEEEVEKVNSRAPVEVMSSKSHLVSGGYFIAHMTSPELPDFAADNFSVMALRQALLMRIVGAKYVPADDVGYTYVARIYGGSSPYEDLLRSQRWNSDCLVPVGYDNLGPDLTKSVLYLAYELSGKPDVVSDRLFYLICDMRAIKEVGLAGYLSYCDKLDWLSPVDRALLASTFSVFRGAVSVYDGPPPEYAKVVVHHVDDEKGVSLQEDAAAGRVSPLFDGYVACAFLKNLEHNAIEYAGDKLKKDGKKEVSDMVNAVKELLAPIIPGWVSVAGLRKATSETLGKAIARAAEDAAEILSVVDKSRDLSAAASALAKVGGLDKLAEEILKDADSRPSLEQVKQTLSRLPSISKDEQKEALAKFLVSLSRAMNRPLDSKEFWEECTKLEKSGDIYEKLKQVAHEMTRDERVAKLLDTATPLLKTCGSRWHILHGLLSRDVKDLAPFIVLRVGEELGVGAEMDKVYKYAVPGDLGEALAKLYREHGVVVPVTAALEGADRAAEYIKASDRLDELMPYSAFYSFGVPVQNARLRYGKYERHVPLYKYLELERYGRPVEVVVYGVEPSSEKEIVKKSVAVGVAAELFKFFDKVVLGYVRKLREWGCLDEKAQSTYHGLLYIFSGRSFAREETIEDPLIPLYANYLDVASIAGEFSRRAEGRLGKLKKVQEFVANKWRGYRRTLEDYERKMSKVVANMYSWVQYVHPKYLSAVVNASIGFYNNLEQFLGGGVEERVSRTIDRLEQKVSNGDLKNKEKLDELKKLFGEFTSKVRTYLGSSSIYARRYDPDSIFSFYNLAKTVATLLLSSEEHRKFKEMMMIVAAVEEEERREREKKKEKKREEQAQPQTAQQEQQTPQPQVAQPQPGEGGAEKVYKTR